MLAAPGATQSLQQDFDAAQAAYDGGDLVAAAERFEALLRRMPQKNLALTNKATAVIRLRLGLSRLAIGDTERAIESIKASLPGLPSGTASETQEVAIVHADLARAHATLGDFAAARAAYQRALALVGTGPESREALSIQVGLARASLFDEPDLARRTLDAVLPVAERSLLAAERKTDRDLLGDLYSLRGRVELNAGRHAEAQSWFEKALKTAGGLGQQVTISDVRIRSDLAIASYLLGKKEEARRYLLYTGAGRLDNDIGFAGAMNLPNCGQSTGIAPEDMAVVEFAITSVGRVTGVMPVYATRPAIAAAFARAVSAWTWSRQDVARMDPFWRASIRLELRCSQEAQLADLSHSFDAAADAWFAAKGLQPVDVGTRSKEAALSFLRGEIRRRSGQHGENSPQLLPALAALIRQGPPWEERQKIVSRYAALLTAAGAPADVRVPAEVASLTGIIQKELGDRKNPQAPLLRRRELLSQLLDRLKQRGEDGGRAGAFARAELAASYGTGRIAEARQFYRQVAEAPLSQLPEDDPVRKAARLQLATLDELQRRAGIQATPCDLADPIPLPVNERIGNEAFPQEAMEWGFSGWVKVAYDVTSQGQPANLRTVMAYPPFIFGPATEKAFARFRYQPLPVSAGNLGCSAMTRRVRYIMP